MYSGDQFSGRYDQEACWNLEDAKHAVFNYAKGIKSVDCGKHTWVNLSDVSSDNHTFRIGTAGHQQINMDESELPDGIKIKDVKAVHVGKYDS